MKDTSKIFHVMDIRKEPRSLSYVIQIESEDRVEERIPFSFQFNRDVTIYDSSILYMFESMFDAPANMRNKGKYRLVVDLKPDVELEKLRAGYTNLLLADGTGLDSHAIRLLAGDCKCLKYATLVDLKGVELESIDKAEYDTEDSVLISGQNYLKNRSIQDVRLDFTHDGNRLYLLMLLIDHFKARKVLTADTEKLAIKSFYGKTTDLYTCNFIYGDIGTAFVNAVMDPDRYFDRLLNCGFYPPFKNLRKYLTAKFIESKYGVKIFTPEREDLFFEVNKIDIASNGGLLEILKSYKKQKLVSTGLQLYDVYLITLNAADENALRSRIVHNKAQAEIFDAVMRFVREEYALARQELENIKLFDFDKLSQAFGDGKDSEFYGEVRRNLMRINPDIPKASQAPRFSFVMPAYNRAFCIRRSIDSLMKQTARDFELIVVDDGSTDDTEKIVATEYAEEIANGRIRYVKTENGGVCKARNTGLSMARGEWIAYLDSDNEIVPDFVETFEKAIGEHSEAEAFYAKLEFMASKRIIGRAFDFEALRFHNFIDLGTYVHKRSLCDMEGVFDEKMTRLVDWELILRYSTKHTPVFIDKVLLHYDDSSETNRITNSGRSSYYVNLNYLRRKHCQDYPVVTTVVTSYNHEKYIAQAIESAISQEGRFIHEILVSDDCSSDDTPNIIRNYAEKNPGLVFDISGGQNLGISANMKKCFMKASGKYVAILEGDDYWCSNRKLAKQVDFLEENEDCSMVFSRVKVLRNNVEQSLSRHDKLPRKLTGREFFNAETLSLLVNFSCCMFRTKHLQSLPDHLYDNRLSEIALAFYLETKGYIGYIPEMLSIYRIHSAGEWSGASVIGKRLQERFCRVVASSVCRPEYRPDFARHISQIDEQILKREKELEHQVEASRKSSAAAEHASKAAVKKSAECERRLLAERRERKKIDETLNRLKRDKKRLELELQAQKKISALKSSEAYRIGMFMTWPLRKAWKVIKVLGGKAK